MQAVLLAGKRPTLAVLTLAALFSWPAAFGQEIRFMPIRSAPLGSPAGTIGDPVTAEFNTALGCWEYRISAGGIEVDLDLQAFGWGDALCTQPTGLCRLDPGDDCIIPVDCAACEDDLDCLHRLGEDGTCTDNGATCSGSGGACINDADCPMGELCIGRLAPCTLGAIQATVVPDGYANGQGVDLNPKGWPGSPGDGAYQSILACSDNGDPCNAPFGTGCGNRPGAICARNPNWVMPDCAVDVTGMVTSTLNYAWGVAAQVDCNIDDGLVKTMGGLILEVPNNASGTYVIALDTSPFASFMTDGAGTSIPDVALTPACITVIAGSCCSNIGQGTPMCEENLTEQECQLRPPPVFWGEDSTCEECGCPACVEDAACDDADACTADVCDSTCFQCTNASNYDEATECCDSASGELTMIDDGDACTIDTCNPTTGQVSHTDNPDCIFDADAFPKNRYVSFETGVLPVDLAFHVRMTASAHFPESIGDLGWVGAPDSKGTALVVSDPVFLPNWPAVVRAGDCEIVPAATYEIRATGDGVNFGPPVVVDTTAPPTPMFWGDIVGEFNGMAWTPPNGVLNFADVQAAIKTFQGGASTAPLIWADIVPETPNRIVNINEVLWLILAFRGEPYPFRAPAVCP